MKLLDVEKLERSSVVANCLMNRERQAFGDNSYEKELHFDLLEFLNERAGTESCVRWFDLCCGSGKALIQVAGAWRHMRANHQLECIGIDLAGVFAPIPDEFTHVRLMTASVHQFYPPDRFDLITCVHGLHYIGDKLGTIIRYIGCLKDDGVFLGHLDPQDVFDCNGERLNRTVLAWFKEVGLQYHARRKLLACFGRKSLELPLNYVGANDRYGPNYTGQKTVSSYYALKS